MRVFSHVLHWLAYSVILSFMPIGINYLSAVTFAYTFSVPDALSDLLITDFCLAATVLRDVIEGRYILLKRLIFFLMLGVCLISAVFFGHTMMMIGLGQEIAPPVLSSLGRWIAALLIVTTFTGIVTQILREIPDTRDRHGVEALSGSKGGNDLG